MPILRFGLGIVSLSELDSSMAFAESDARLSLYFFK